jgi:ketosteroid isomerase-like protein
MNKNAEQVWQAFMQSVDEKTDVWQALLADDVSFTGPCMQIQGKDAYIKTTLDFFQMVKDFRLHHYVAGDSLIATEESFTVATPSGGELTLDVAEFFEIRNGRIKSVKIYYDAEAFRQAFAIEQHLTA